MMSSKKPKIILPLLCVYIFSFFGLTLGPLVPKSYAAGEQFTFFMNTGAQADIARAVDGSPITGPDPMLQTAVYAKGGFFGAEPLQFQFTATPIPGGKNFIYEATYFCNGSGEISRTQTSAIGTKVTLQIQAPLNKSFVNTGSAGISGVPFGVLPSTITSPDVGKVNSKCLPAGLPNNVSVTSFQNLSASAKTAFGTLQTTAAVRGAADAANPANTTGAPAPGEPDCTTDLQSILSWIICPIIDMGAAFTDFVFKDFIQPMLENVPVSTDPTDPTYKSWAAFRLMGNLLLVGTLLAIVYSQAKGGGGR